MDNFKRTICTFIYIAIVLLSLPASNAFATDAAPPLNAEGACLLDANTGQVVYGKNVDTKYYPASTTKVLTALIVLEHSNLDDKVTIGREPCNADGSRVGIRPTETYTVYDLLLGLLMMSGNDCANSLAEYVSGSTESFANLMNEKAAKLGCNNSHFVNPSGLPDPNHYTTPRDLALIMKACIQNKDFIKICNTHLYTLPPSSIDGNEMPISNHNYILFESYPKYYYEGSIASKKGYTVAAQFTNIMAAKRGNTTLVCSLLKDNDIYTTYSDCHKLLDYGFNNFETKIIYKKEDCIGNFKIGDKTFSLYPLNDVYYTYPIENKDKLNLSLEYDIPTDIGDNDFNSGDKIMTASISQNGEKIKDVDLFTDSDYIKPDKLINKTKSSKASEVLISVIVGLFTLTLPKIIYKRRFKKTESK